MKLIVNDGEVNSTAATVTVTAAATVAAGINWIDSPPTESAIFGIAWAGTQFATVGYDGIILTSSDGISWTGRTSGTSASLSGITWSGTQFAAVGEDGIILTSSDGITWTARTSGTTNQFSGIA